MTVGAWGWAQLAGFGLALPWAAYRSRRRLALLLELPRQVHFTVVLGQQLLFLAVSVLVAWRERILLLPPQLPGASAAAFALAMLVAGWVTMRPLWRRMVARRDPRVHLIMPRTGRERLLWVGISLAAGVGEEITYRGVMYALLLRLLGSAAPAVALASAAFGVAHAVQGWRAVLLAALFALGFHALVLYSGSLYLAMTVHAVYDVVAGLTLGWLGERLGYPADGRVAVTAAEG